MSRINSDTIRMIQTGFRGPQHAYIYVLEGIYVFPLFSCLSLRFLKRKEKNSANSIQHRPIYSMAHGVFFLLHMRRQATHDEIELRLQTETRISSEFHRTVQDARIKMLFFRLIVSTI